MKRGRFEKYSKIKSNRLALILAALIVLVALVCVTVTLLARHNTAKLADAISGGREAEALELLDDSCGVYRRLGGSAAKDALEDWVAAQPEQWLRENSEVCYQLAVGLSMSEKSSEAMKLLSGAHSYRTVRDALAAGDILTAEEVYAEMNDEGFERYRQNVVSDFRAAVRAMPYHTDSAEELVGLAALDTYADFAVFAETLDLPAGDAYLRYIEGVLSLEALAQYNEIYACFRATSEAGTAFSDLSALLEGSVSGESVSRVIQARADILRAALETARGFDSQASLVGEYTAALEEAVQIADEAVTAAAGMDHAAVADCAAELAPVRDTFEELQTKISYAIGDTADITAALPRLNYTRIG